MEISAIAQVTEDRAKQSLGMSNEAIYRMVVRALDEWQISGNIVVDVGCGAGLLRSYLKDRFKHYIGVDVVRYEAFPTTAEFHRVNLDTGRASLPDEVADVVVSTETIEHLENPRAFMRELVRLTKPGGWVIVTTPNQLSIRSLITLIIKHRFASFQDVDYPMHITALLEIDLKRMASECGLMELAVRFSMQGRIVFTPRHYPQILARLFPRTLSDNLLLIGRRLDAI